MEAISFLELEVGWGKGCFAELQLAENFWKLVENGEINCLMLEDRKGVYIFVNEFDHGFSSFVVVLFDLPLAQFADFIE